VFRADAETGDMFDALRGRLARVIGADFTDNALRIDAERDGLRLTGYAALPTWSRGAAVAQFLFVNGRPVLDRMLFGACAPPIRCSAATATPARCCFWTATRSWWM
jgi:DNA mismatch repair protein MutL